MDSTSELIFNYEILPARHPVVGAANGTGEGTSVLRTLDGSALTSPLIVVTPVGDSSRDSYAKVLSLSARNTNFPYIDGILPSINNVSVSWNYPVIEPEVVLEIQQKSSDPSTVGTTFGSRPIAIASVAYELKILEGTFYDEDFYEEFSPGLMEPLMDMPGPIVFEKTVNLADPSIPIYLDTQKIGSTDITDGILQVGQSYTVAFRHLVWHPSVGQGREWTQTVMTGNGPVHYSQGETMFFHFLTQWSLFRFSVNLPPSVSSLRVNGLKNPKIARGDDVVFSFTASDPDGPELLYRIELGTQSGANFSMDVFDSGIVRNEEHSAQSIDVQFKYPGTSLSPSVDYYWRASVQDGLASGGVSDGTDTFRINSPPVITSLKADGNELLFGVAPIVKNEGLQISWQFSDADSDTQKAYALVLSSNGKEILNTGQVASGVQSVTVPNLPENVTIEVSLRLKDDIEFGSAATGSFQTNSIPSVRDLMVQGQENPRTVTTTTPTFSWTFEDSDNDQQEAFRIQVATDTEFANLIWDTGNVSGASSSVVYGSTASPVVPPQALSHGRLYYMRTMVSDGTSYSDYVTAFFAINRAPGNPTLALPTTGAYSWSIPVQWVEASPLDPDGDTVTYTLEITDESSFARNWVFLAGPMASGITTYSLDITKIPAGDNYGVRIIASDGFADSNPASGGTSPRLTISNHAPNSPIILRPKASDRVSRILRVEWAEANPVDIDGDAVLYELWITGNASNTSPTWSILGTFSQGETGTFVDVSDLADGTDYRLRVRAVDAPGLAGAYQLSGIFEIVNSLAINDFERLNGSLYLASSDGRIFRAQDTIWQVDEDWSDQRGRVHFDVFERDNPKAHVANGKLVISPVPGATYLLRHSDDNG